MYQQVLGVEFEGLAPELKSYFSRPDTGFHGRGSGVFEVAGPSRRWLTPLFALLGPGRMLFPEYGESVPFAVVNRTIGDTLHAERIFLFPARSRTMVDRMQMIDGRLHDFLGDRARLEVALVLAVDGGRLTMISTDAWVHIGRRRVRLPALLSARVHLTEEWEHDHQRVSVSLRHPLLGEVFAYRGTFTYANEPD